MRRPICLDCMSERLQSDSTTGSTYCVDCGVVQEESAIVSDITFTEATNGAQRVQGSFVAANATGTRIMGPSGRSSGMESSEMTKQRSIGLLRNFQQTFKVPDSAATIAERHLTLAYKYNFTKGRHIEHVIVVCLYMGCKEAKTSHMLIDFADGLRINVFALGSTYLKWMKLLGIQTNELVEPSIFISRFVALLEFGDDQHQVALDATRIAAHFKSDWIHEGRRTSGICGAAIYLAAQMNNYRRSIQEIVQVCKIADTTIVKRLEEFNATDGAEMSVGDFRLRDPHNRTDTADPPSFTRARLKEQEEVEGLEAGRVAKRGRKRDRSEYEDSDRGSTPERQMDGQLFLRSRHTSAELQAGTNSQGSEEEMRMMGNPEAHRSSALVLAPRPEEGAEAALSITAADKSEEITDDPEREQEVQDVLNSQSGQEAQAVARRTLESRRAEEEAERQARFDAHIASQTELDDRPREETKEYLDLEGLDEEELDGYLCTEEEARVKERVWTEFNLDYLRKLATKRLQDQTGENLKAKKKRKAKKKEPFTPGKTAYESVHAMMQTNKAFSKRINYKVLQSALPNELDKKDEDEDEGEKYDDEKEDMDDDMKEFYKMRGELNGADMEDSWQQEA